MRETIIKINEEYKSIMSTDLGAISGLLFEICIGKISLDENWETALDMDLSTSPLDILKISKRGATCLLLFY